MATIVVGFSSLDWLPDLSGLGNQTGLWDLGFQNPDDLAQRGRVLLNVPNPASAGGSPYTDLELRVVQFVDGFFYTGGLTFSIPGATFSGRTVVEPLPPPGGNWVEDRFHWRLSPSPAQVSLSITGAVSGTVLDRIRLDTAGQVIPKLVITSVQKSSQGLAISWSGGLPPYQVYVASNLLNNELWQPVGQPVSATNTDVPLSGPIGFVKVGGSN